MDEQLPASPCPKATSSQEKISLVNAAENITVPPRYRQISVGRLDPYEKQNSLPQSALNRQTFRSKKYSLSADYHESGQRRMNPSCDVIA